MSELPVSWESTTIGELADVISGAGFPNEHQGNSSGEIGFFKVSDISAAVLNNSGLLDNPVNYISLATASLLKAKPLPVGATVFAKIGEAIRLNRRAYVTRPCLIDNNVMAVKSFTDDLDRYLYLFLRTISFSDQSRATTVPSLRKGDVQEIPFPLPPLPEQKRIADKLDTLLARIDACRDRLDRIPKIIKQFRQSVLAAATSGRLTEDWRTAQADHVARMQPQAESGMVARDAAQCHYEVTPATDAVALLPGNGTDKHQGQIADKWNEFHLADCIEKHRVITYGVIKLGNEVDDGIPCLRTSNVRWLHIEIEGVKRIAPDLSASYSRTVLKGGEILVNVRGTLGGVAIATHEMAGWNVSREVAVVPINQYILTPQFAAFWIASEESQHWLKKVEKGVAYTGINK